MAIMPKPPLLSMISYPQPDDRVLAVVNAVGGESLKARFHALVPRPTIIPSADSVEVHAVKDVPPQPHTN